MKNDDLVILAAKRSPFGKFGGALKDFTVPQLSAPLIDAMLEEIALSHVDRLVLGQALSAGQGQHVAKQIVREAKNMAPPWDDFCKASSVERACNSSLQALWGACKFARDESELVVVVGAESMSQAPYLWERPQGLYGDIRQENSQNLSSAIASLKGEENGVLVNKFPEMIDSLLHDGLLDAWLDGNPHMGEIADGYAKFYNIERQDQDYYAFESHRKAYMASNLDSDLRNPGSRGMHVEDYPIDCDEGVREPNLEAISQLPPVFGESITAGNSSQLSDGAAVVLVASHRMARSYKIKPIARIVAIADCAGVASGYLDRPAQAARNVMQKCGLLTENIDLFEVHEPFAVGGLEFANSFGKGFHLAREMFMDKMNIWGGSIAVGHPLGATGARLVVNLVHALAHRKGRYGLATSCNGGGEGMAVIIENLQK